MAVLGRITALRFNHHSCGSGRNQGHAGARFMTRCEGREFWIQIFSHGQVRNRAASSHIATEDFNGADQSIVFAESVSEGLPGDLNGLLVLGNAKFLPCR